MMRKTIILSLPNFQATTLLAQKLATEITNYLLRKPNLIVLLEGELGSGKTTFVKALGRKIGVKTRIKSPTFVLWQIHQFFYKRKKFFFHHMDLYRLHQSREILSLFRQAFEIPNSLFLIEWGEKLERHLPKGKITVQFTITGKRSRQVKLIYDF
jgi:tRNA threonylcarbamoyladenosine biosynthesis protein TsaE